VALSAAEVRTSTTHCVSCGHRLPGHYDTCPAHHRPGTPGESSTRDHAPAATRHVNYDDDCPGCSTARCTGHHGTGSEHTCGVW
jgi:hypothetical protein